MTFAFALFGALVSIISAVLAILNRRTTAKKEAVDGLVLELSLRKDESARRDTEIAGLKARIKELEESEDRKSTRLNSSHLKLSRMPSSA